MLLVARARTALKLAFSQAGLKPGDKILVPDFVCEALIQPIVQMNLVPVPYILNDGLEPVWDELEVLANSTQHSAIVMVHFFGQPQNIAKFKDIAKRCNLLLVEDNAQGHGGKVSDMHLGTFGDLGISSPRKFIGTPSGGCLYGAASEIYELSAKLPPYPAYGAKSFARCLLYRAQPLWRISKGILDRGKNWSDPFLFRESLQDDFQIDSYSKRRIKNVDWQKIAENRRNNWRKWAVFAQKMGLNPVFGNVHSDSCPLAMPAYAENIDKRNSILEWGVKHRIPLFPWPSLPESIIFEKGSAFKRWENFVCFPLNCRPENSR